MCIPTPEDAISDFEEVKNPKAAWKADEGYFGLSEGADWSTLVLPTRNNLTKLMQFCKQQEAYYAELYEWASVTKERTTKQ